MTLSTNFIHFNNDSQTPGYRSVSERSSGITELTVSQDRNAAMADAARNTVLITGANSGIGHAAAMLFSRSGYDCILVARNEDALRRTAVEIHEQTGRNAIPLVADVTRGREFIELLLPVLERYTPLAVIANAGIGQYGPVSASEWEHVAAVLRTNIDGALATVHAALPGMLHRRRGSVILISSTLGKRAIPFNAAYCASKYALHGYADALRLEVSAYGIHVGVVCPARTDTPFFSRMTYSIPQGAQRKVPTSPPEHVARAILRCMHKRRREVHATFTGALFGFAGVHFPRVMDFVLSRAVPRPEIS
jgi:short-subunit dehydrogenase